LKRILIIPHHPDFEKIKIRLAELARWFSLNNEVYLLDWHSSLGRNLWLGRLGACIVDALRRPRVYKHKFFNVVEIPMLHRPLCWAKGFNALWLRKIVESLKIDIVVNGSYYLFSIPENRSFKYIVDLADVPSSGARTKFDAFIDSTVKAEIAKTDSVTASSQGLVEYIGNIYGAKAHFIPNGADLEKLKSASRKEADYIRRKYGLENKWVIGYIGNFGEWVDIDFLVSVYKQAKLSIPDAALLIVGSSDRLAHYKRFYNGADIVFTGPVSPNLIEDYFLACDVGVLPNKKSLFQDLAFHIKLIEFGAARKMVLSSDMDEVKKTELGHVVVVPLSVEDWVKALIKIKAQGWNADWEKRLKDFDWTNIADSFQKIIASL
jgi:glycosyltransferase involved in cell wall biosynthesis